jgi:hypothetical protein
MPQAAIEGRPKRFRKTGIFHWSSTTAGPARGARRYRYGCASLRHERDDRHAPLMIRADGNRPIDQAGKTEKAYVAECRSGAEITLDEVERVAI